MGLYDRDYERNTQVGLQLSAPQSVTMRIVALTGCVYLLQVMTEQSGWVTNTLALRPLWYQEPWKFFQLLSYGFLHSTQAFEHILLNMYGLWLFGRDIERKLGRKEFLTFYLSAIVIAGLVWNLATIAEKGFLAQLIGASGGVVAITILYALYFPHRTILFMFVFPMPMWVLGCIIVLMDAFGATARTGTSNVAFVAHLGGAVFALAYYKLGWSPGRWLVGRLSGVSSRIKLQPKLRIHEPDERGTATDQQVDEILQKIQEQGQASLTRRERRILEKASKEYQHKRS